MTAATADEVALCAAIRANPDEDVPRLQLADELDGEPVDVPCPACDGKGGKMCKRYTRGAGGAAEYWEDCPHCKNTHTVRDASRPLRAELIRVQVELAAIDAQPVQSVIHYADGSATKAYVPVPRRGELRARESELAARLARDHPGLYPACPACKGRSYTTRESGRWEISSYCDHCKGTGRVGSWVRGLLSVPVPTLSAVWGRPLYNAGHDTEAWGPCELTPWARGELLTRPWVCEVPVLDREPFRAQTGEVSWHPARAEHLLEPAGRSQLPDFLFDALDGFLVDPRTDAVLKFYKPPAAAQLALARAVARAAFAGAGSRPGG